jgi:hypothetical protein
MIGCVILMLYLKRYQFGKQKVPLKIKVFLWFIHQGVTLTKANLARKSGRVV